MNGTSAVTLLPNAKEESSLGPFPSPFSCPACLGHRRRVYSEGGKVGLEGPSSQMYSQYWNQELEKTARTSAPLFWITGERVSGGALEKKKKNRGFME